MNFVNLEASKGAEFLKVLSNWQLQTFDSILNSVLGIKSKVNFLLHYNIVR